ncbi:transcription factor Ouib [Drosophila bipectinata]|uniref:transcription factor Ouib n=1 Tax=Drosophila bipectinata TaxID=42026 RepID=UPI0038B3EE33
MATRCRLCGESLLPLQAKNLFDNLNRGIISRIKVITGLSLREEVHLPRHICTRCYDHLQLSNGFRERCLQNQKRLAKRIQSKRTQKDFRVCVDHTTDTKISLDHQNVLLATGSSPTPTEDFPKTTLEILCKFEDAGPPGHEEKSFIKILTKVENNIESSGNEPESFECPLVIPKKELSLVDTTIPINPSSPERVLEQQSKTATIKNISSKKSSRKPLKLLCNLCGKYLKSVENLKNHQLRHLGVKEFACQSCNRRFVTKHLLTLHERVRHLGEQPYPCGYCQLCFLTSAARNYHERLKHIKDKKYKCEDCGKQFDTASSRKKHMIIHTGQKPHSCEMCNVSFSRMDHLKVHFRSEKHKTLAKVVDLKWWS